MALRPYMLALGGDKLFLANRTCLDIALSPGTASAFYRLDSDGDISTEDGDSGTDWLVPGVNSASYEVEAVLNSGTLTSGTTGVGTWQNLGTNRTWTRNQVGIGESTAVITVSIRRTSTTTVLATAQITITAEVTS